MKERLFEQFSWSGNWAATVSAAVADVDRLDRKAFSDPALAGLVQKIAEKHTGEVATLDTSAISAKARAEDREGRDGWGDPTRVKVSRLDVTIPFKGEASSFRIHPSSWTTPSQQADIGTNSLTISIIDDANAEATVKTFCETVNGTLNTLRSEYQRDKPQLEKAVNAAAERRKAQIAADSERDSKLSFKVQR